MLRLDDIQSLTDFQRNAREQIKRLKRTGRPKVLTVNGEAALVVQDARSYQRLLDRAEQAEGLRRGIADYRAGRARDVDDVLDDLAARHGGEPRQRGKRARR